MSSFFGTRCKHVQYAKTPGHVTESARPSQPLQTLPLLYFPAFSLLGKRDGILDKPSAYSYPYLLDLSYFGIVELAV